MLYRALQVWPQPVKVSAWAGVGQRRYLRAALASDYPEMEVLVLDDGSTDGSYELIAKLHERDPRVKALRLSRNFGHQIALSAGLDHAQGRAVIIMDGDLQDPPEVALELAVRWREGYDVVYAVRDDRAAGQLLHDGRQPGQQRGRAGLGLRAGRQSSRQSDANLVQLGSQAYGWPGVEPPRLGNQVIRPAATREMSMRSKQTGVTFIGWVILLIPVAICAYAGLRLAPARGVRS